MKIPESAIKCLPPTLPEVAKTTIDPESSHRARIFHSKVQPRIGVSLDDICTVLDRATVVSDAPFFVKLLRSQIIRETSYICLLYKEGYKERDLEKMRVAVHKYIEIYSRKKQNVVTEIQLETKNQPEILRAIQYLIKEAKELEAIEIYFFANSIKAEEIVDDEASTGELLFVVSFLAVFGTSEEATTTSD